MSKFLKAIVNIVLLAAILSAGALLIPPLLGVTTKVSDGTGNTNLSRGSVTYATSAQAADLESGDKILQDDSNGSYVYTVRAVAADASTYTLEDEVSGATQEQQLTGGVQKVAVTLPVIGMLSLTLQTREGVIILGLCVAFLIILFILSEVWRKDEEEEEDNEDDEDDADDTDDEEEDADEDEDKPLSRKEKRRLKKEQKKKAREEEEEREEPETSEDREEDERGKVLPEEEQKIRPLEEEPQEEAVVDTDFLRRTDMADRPEESGRETKSSVQEKEEEDLARSLAAAVGELMGEEKAEAGFEEEQDVLGTNAEEENAAIYIEETETEEEEEPAEEETGTEELQEEASAVPEEEDDRKPVELAIPVHTAEELLKKAEEAGDHPQVIEDRENGVTILDYSDIL